MYYITISVQYVRYSTGRKIRYFIVYRLNIMPTLYQYSTGTVLNWNNFPSLPEFVAAWQRIKLRKKHGLIDKCIPHLKPDEANVLDPEMHIFGCPRIRICSYLYGSGSFHHQAKIRRKTLICRVLRLLVKSLSLKMMRVNVPPVCNKSDCPNRSVPGTLLMHHRLKPKQLFNYKELGAFFVR